jgi:hypothetical protein
MKNLVIKNDQNYRVIAGNAVSVLDTLPPRIYELYFNKETGYSLNEVEATFSITKKLYGNVETLTSRVLAAFEKTEGNLGVLISGPKGLGKSLTTRNICKEALERGLPVILVKVNYGNIVPYIDTICQPCILVMDEFEKLYPKENRQDNDSLEGQDCMLNLFDSTYAAKKLFLLTCNSVYNISEYLLNRPGRLHYHFKVARLTVQEMTEYCTDNLSPEYHTMIPDICALGTRISDFSYDMLRSIIFEINMFGCPLNDVQQVLNIDANLRSPYDFTVYFKSGKIESGFDTININSKKHMLDWREDTYVRCEVNINPSKAKWNGDSKGTLVLTEDIKLREYPENDKKAKDNIVKIIFTPVKKDFLASGYDDDDD